MVISEEANSPGNGSIESKDSGLSRSKRIYIINRDFQFRYIGAAVVIGFISTALTAFVILFPLYLFQILRIPQFLPWPILAGMIAAALVNVVSIALVGVIMTHRIAGPMYSLVRHLRRLEVGNWTGLMQVRQDDELRFVVRNFNGLVQSLTRTAQEDLRLVEAAMQSGQSTSQELATLSDRLRQRLVQSTTEN